MHASLCDTEEERGSNGQILILAMLTQLGSEGTRTEPRLRISSLCCLYVVWNRFLWRLEVYLELLKGRGYRSSLFSNSMTWSAPEEVIMSHPLCCTVSVLVPVPPSWTVPWHPGCSERRNQVFPPGARHLVWHTGATVAVTEGLLWVPKPRAGPHLIFHHQGLMRQVGKVFL